MAITFFKCLEENGLHHKIQGITVDNDSAKTSFIKELQSFIPGLNIQACHFRCFRHIIINLAVQGLFKKLKLDSEPNEEVNDSSSDQESDDQVLVQELEFEDNSNAICKIRSIFSKIAGGTLN